MTAATAYRLEIPSGWTQLPVDAAAAESAIAELVADAGLTEPQARAYETSLRDVLALAQPLKPGHRTNYALVVHEPDVRADSLLSVRITKVVPEAYGEYLEAIERSTQTVPAIEVVNRAVWEAEVGAGRVIALSDVIVRNDQRGIIDAAIDRGIAALFVRDAPVLVEVYLATRNLARFPSIGDYAVEVAARYLPVAGGSA